MCPVISGIRSISLAHFTPTELDHARRMSINISSHIIPGDFTARLLNGIIVRRRNSITLHALHRKVDTLCLAASLAFEGGNKRTVDLSLISEASWKVVLEILEDGGALIQFDQLEWRRLFALRPRDVDQVFAVAFDLKKLEERSLAVDDRAAHTEHRVALRFHPLFLRDAASHLSLPASGNPRQLVEGRWRLAGADRQQDRADCRSHHHESSNHIKSSIPFACFAVLCDFALSICLTPSIRSAKSQRTGRHAKVIKQRRIRTLTYTCERSS